MSEVMTPLALDEAWGRVRTQLKACLGLDVFNSWLLPVHVEPEYAKENHVCLSVPTSFLVYWVRGQYLDLIQQLWRGELGETVEVEIALRQAGRISLKPDSDGKIYRRLLGQAYPAVKPKEDSLSPTDKVEAGEWVDELSLSRLDMIARDHFLSSDEATIELCQIMVAAHHGVNVGYIISAQRTRSAVRLCSMAVYLAKLETRRSFRALGQKFNGRTHASLLHSFRDVEVKLPSRPDLREEIALYHNAIKRWKPVVSAMSEQ
jgi:chromosomal replication initiation ATPase DnaA